MNPEENPILEEAREQAEKELTEAEKAAKEAIEQEQREFQEEIKKIDDLSEEIFQLILSKEYEYYDGTKALDQAKVRLTNKLNDIVEKVVMTNKSIKFVIEDQIMESDIIIKIKTENSQYNSKLILEGSVNKEVIKREIDLSVFVSDKEFIKRLAIGAIQTLLNQKL